jgi:hypothetical protein
VFTGRFYDGREVYITICPNGTSASQTSHSESCGKNCISTVDDFQMQVTSTEQSGNKSTKKYEF